MTVNFFFLRKLGRKRRKEGEECKVEIEPLPITDKMKLV